RDGGEVRRAEAQHFGGIAGLVALLAHEIGPALAEAGVIVDDECDGNAAALRGLELGEVIVEGTVAAVADDLAMRRGAFSAEGRRKGPAERAGSAQVRLP